MGILAHAVQKLLFRLLGLKNYLSLLSSVFYLIYKLGFLRSNPVYEYHYFVKKLIKPGDYVLDLGTNLGYYSQIFAQLVGKSGRVISIEAIPLFSEVAKKQLRSKDNCEVHNVAFGLEEKNITLQVPFEAGLPRHGRASISDVPLNDVEYVQFEARMVRGSAYLSFLQKLDYIKCDIEGYEQYVLPEIKPLLDRFRPVLQIETSGEHRQGVLEFLEKQGYERYNLGNGKLHKNLPEASRYYEFIFIPKEKEAAFAGLISAA